MSWDPDRTLKIFLKNTLYANEISKNFQKKKNHVPRLDKSSKLILKAHVPRRD